MTATFALAWIFRSAGLSMPLLATRRVTPGTDLAELLTGLLVAGGSLAALSGAVYGGRRWLRRHWRHSHAALFRGLCDAQGLDRAARRLLAQIGRHHRLRQPSRLFTEPEWLDPANLSAGFQARAEEIAILRTRIFSLAAAKTNG